MVDVDLPVKRVPEDLTSGTRYYVRAVDGGFRSAATFVTSDDPGVVDGFRFGVTGDSRGDNAPYHGVTNVPRRKLDVFIELGDTVYADVESPILPGVAKATTLAEFRTKHTRRSSRPAAASTRSWTCGAPRRCSPTTTTR